MELKYIGDYRPELLSFWDNRIRFDFYIIYKEAEEEMILIFEKEFRLNCRNQLK